MDIVKEMQYVAKKVDEFLSIFLQVDFSPSDNLIVASKYSLVNQGKRFRPFLCYILAKTIGVKEDTAFYLGAVIEIIHTYTLIHDDLPAMDNDDYRRGKLSNHKKFNEYTAILCGDALQAEAFYLLSSEKFKLKDDVKIKIINKVAEIIGARNLIAGQQLDLDLQNNNIQCADIQYINYLKTSKLISLCFTVIAIVGEKDDGFIEKISLYGEKIGNLFQIIDDFKDIEEENSINLVREIGVARAKDICGQINQESIAILESINLINLSDINRYLLNKLIKSN